MTIQLTIDQERRIEAVMAQGAYQSVEEIVEAGLIAVEGRIEPGFTGTEEELDALLTAGLASKELSENEFWESVNSQTDVLLAEYKANKRP